MKPMLILSLFLLFVSPLFSQTKAWISLYGQDTFELDGTRETDTLLIPVNLDDGISFTNVSIAGNKPVYTRLNNKFKKRYADALNISKANSPRPSLQVIADLRTLNKSGKYEAILVFTTEGQKNQELVLPLLRPAATLDTVNNIRINIEGNESRSDPFVIKETGNLSNIQQLYLAAPLITGFNETELITFPSNPYFVKAGNLFKAQYTLHDSLLPSLPLGITKGKMEISAPELSGSLIIPVEIMNKRSKLWIILTIFLGLFLGAFVRIYIKNKKAWEETKLQGFDLLDKIKRETIGIQDAAFQDNIKTLTDALYQAIGDKGIFDFLRQGTNVQLTKSIEDTATKYNQLKTTFDDDFKKALDAFRDISSCFENNNLSAIIRKKLSVAEESYVLAKNSITRYDPTTAQASIGKTVLEINDFLDKFNIFLSFLLKSMAEDAFYPKTNPPEVRESIKENVLKINEELVKLTTHSSDNKEIVKSVSTADLILSRVKNLLNVLTEAVANAFNQLYTDNDTPLMTEFKKYYEEWKTALENLIKEPFVLMDAAVIENLKRVFKELEENDAIIPETGVEGDEEAAFEEWKNKLTREGITQYANGAYFIDMGSKLTFMQVSGAASRRNWILYTGVQLAILLLLSALGAYKFYGPSFIGTTDELITIFLFAFGLDITLESVLQLGDKKS